MNVYWFVAFTIAKQTFLIRFVFITGFISVQAIFKYCFFCYFVGVHKILKILYDLTMRPWLFVALHLFMEVWNATCNCFPLCGNACGHIMGIPSWPFFIISVKPSAGTLIHRAGLCLRIMRGSCPRGSRGRCTLENLTSPTGTQRKSTRMWSRCR